MASVFSWIWPARPSLADAPKNQQAMPVRKLAPGPGETYDVNSKPPPFGHLLKQYFAFDESYVNLNHGTRSNVLVSERLGS